MPDLEQHEYFERRAQEERTAAAKAKDERAAQSHRDLAQQYERKASEGEPAEGQHPEILPPRPLGEGLKIIP